MNQPEMMRGPTGGQVSDTSRQQALSDFMDPQRPLANVVGFGHGVKWTNGEPTGEEAVVVFVTQKLPESMLPERDVIPHEMDDGTPTDVMAVGNVTALPQGAGGRLEEQQSQFGADGGLLTGTRQQPFEELAQLAAMEPQLLNRRLRPCPSGFSVGSVQITAGTLGSVVYDFLPGASNNPPGPGIGVPSKFYILSNNHVLANSNRAAVGTAVVQPGPADGGTLPNDLIGKLSRFIPIQFAPQIPLTQHNNVVDAALAEVSFQDATRDQYFSGPPRAWRRKSGIAVGQLVKKTGRTTNLSLGRITAVNATIDVNYGTAGVARFKDQILTTNISAGGDSGSLVMSYDNVAVGLLFAGSTTVTVLNQIENVRALLRVEIAEQLA